MRAGTHLRWGTCVAASAVLGCLWMRSARANDARLLALERSFHDHRAALLDRMASAPEDDPLIDTHMERMFAAADAMQLIPADSLAGVAAKARVTESHRRDNTESDTLSCLQADALDELLTFTAPRHAAKTQRTGE
ncbi:hypothetical protein SAMN05216241_10934 [Limimonas halophila]|uniref:Uncharacterized protein n=1 Tax=Limimonas halophila TaxID=1082479 RepID=A0A1G7TDZ5_9PROT|nr:hypothetical protein SAMN05216241_10934 [Limimonas halophila]